MSNRVVPSSRWFVTAPNGRWAPVRGYDKQEWVPTGTVHAKTMGTTLTACGAMADTWSKFWDQPFQSVTVDACQACRAVVAYDERERGRVSHSNRAGTHRRRGGDTAFLPDRDIP
jgi:hypothetical protein